MCSLNFKGRPWGGRRSIKGGIGKSRPQKCSKGKEKNRADAGLSRQATAKGRFCEGEKPFSGGEGGEKKGRGDVRLSISWGGGRKGKGQCPFREPRKKRNQARHKCSGPHFQDPEGRRMKSSPKKRGTEREPGKKKGKNDARIRGGELSYLRKKERRALCAPRGKKRRWRICSEGRPKENPPFHYGKKKKAPSKKERGGGGTQGTTGPSSFCTRERPFPNIGKKKAPRGISARGERFSL